MNVSAEPNTAIVAALEREVSRLTRPSRRIQREHAGRTFTFFERDNAVIVCGGIGLEAARRAAEAAIALYQPSRLHSVGFAGALQSALHVGDIFVPAAVIDARDGSRVEIPGGNGVLVTFLDVAGKQQKVKLAQAYCAQAVDMEAAAVAAAAHAHGLAFCATKVISDGFDFDMPDTTPFIDSQGRFKTAAFAAHITLRPWLWGKVGTLALNSRKAAKTLADYLNHPRSATNGAVAAKTV